MALTSEQQALFKRIAESSFLTESLIIKNPLEETEDYAAFALAIMENYNFQSLYIEQWTPNIKAIEQIASALQTSQNTKIRYISLATGATISEILALIGILKNQALEYIQIDECIVQSVDEIVAIIRALTDVLKVSPINKKLLIDINGQISLELFQKVKNHPQVTQVLADFIQEMKKNDTIVQCSVSFINHLNIKDEIDVICQRNRHRFKEKEIEKKFKEIEQLDEEQLQNPELIKQLKSIHAQLTLVSSMRSDFLISQGVTSSPNKDILQTCQIKIMSSVIALTDPSNFHSPALSGFIFAGLTTEITGVLNDLKQWTLSKSANEKSEIEKLIVAISQVKEQLQLAVEQAYVLSGWYQHELYHFTYNYKYFNKEINNLQIKLGTETELKELEYNLDWIKNRDFSYQVCLLMNEPAFRCTVSIPVTIDSPLEIQINFFGTIDFASQCVALDIGGPGQELIKQHEVTLLNQVNHLMEQISFIFPGQTFRLRIAGHSLGGALAKAFTHTLQRGMAIQDREPSEILEKITTEIKKNDSDLSHYQQELGSLKHMLEQDKKRLDHNRQLKKVEGITLYALGAPGISIETDMHASLMTYDKHPNFLRVYHHQHAEDIIPKFGETEFLSGKKIKPNVHINQHIVYKIPIQNSDLIYDALPFPGCNKKVMAAHNKLIFGGNAVSVIENLAQSKVVEKFYFHPIRYSLYRTVKDVAGFLSQYNFFSHNFSSLSTLPKSETKLPVLGEKAFYSTSNSEDLESHSDESSLGDDTERKAFDCD